MEKHTLNRYLWIDAMRTIGILMVIGIHTAGYFVTSNPLPLGSGDWWIAHALNAGLRAGVPLFFMVSGYLMLVASPTLPIQQFLSKRLLRIGIPLLVWTTVYLCIIHFVNHAPLTPTRILKVLSEPAYYHLWFLYSMAGLYLVTPLIRPLMIAANRPVIQYLLIFWFMGMSISMISETFFHVPINGNFTRVLPVYLGFFIAGALLPESRSTARVYSFVIPLLLICWGITLWGGYFLTITHNAGYNNSMNNYLMPPVIIMSGALFVGIFEWCKRHELPLPLAKIITTIGQCSFGMYLIHPIIKDMLKNGLGTQYNLKFLDATPVMSMLVIGCLTAVISLTLTWLARRIPFVKSVF